MNLSAMQETSDCKQPESRVTSHRMQKIQRVILLAVEQSAWLSWLIERLQNHQPKLAVTVIAPWAIASGQVKWSHRLPGLSSYVSRRCPTFATTEHSLAWQSLQGGLRALTHGNSSRKFHGNFIERRLFAHWAEQALTRDLDDSCLVIAPSIAAREVLSLAKTRGAKTALFLDIPHLHTMHRDLDAAAANAQPDAFLHHFRAPSWAIARQRAEFALADHVLVRGEYAGLAVLRQSPAANIAVLDVQCSDQSVPAIEFDSSSTAPVLLAGVAAARNGCWVALHAAQQMNRKLIARRGEATEPAFLQQPDVLWIKDKCPPAAAVVAPAFCESYLRIATSPGVRRIGSRNVTGVAEVCEPSVISLGSTLLGKGNPPQRDDRFHYDLKQLLQRF
jgi:hypothetical protein